MAKQIKAYFILPFYPEEATKAVFKETDSYDLRGELDNWLPAAFANKLGQYVDPEDREKLILFLKDFDELIEVMSPPYFLNKIEYTITSEEFSDKYSMKYIRQELFDLFLSVATYEGPIEVDKGNVGEYYIYFSTLAECALLLNKKD